ncbi:hypothetical protein ACGFNU_17625 [Spirillospora sp. NPDC048911]|uniref:hypothetical protein n=1 Tax=Spirillospora sp. NPDC048911 TaxID=3364527 RepID=UPI003711E1CD
MAGHEAFGGQAALEVGAHWQWMIENWATRNGIRATTESSSVSVEIDLPKADRVATMRFTTASRLLVAFITDDRSLERDRLALAAAAANAWNTEQLIPMLSVWDVRGPHPFLAGVCVLPLTSQMSQPVFDDLADHWLSQVRQMFTRCHQVFGL